MKIAVIKSRGRQYVVKEGGRLVVDRYNKKVGDTITFDQVLLTSFDDNVRVGQPNVQGATVTANIIAHGRHKKVVGVKIKAKKRYQRLLGHKQWFTQLSVTDISAP